MIEKIQELIIKETLEKDNKKINEKESLRAYLSSFKNYQLIRLSVIHVWVDDDFTDLYKIQNLSKKKKDYIVNYVTENLDVIIKSFIKVLDTDKINVLKKIINHDGNVKYGFDNFSLSPYFIAFIKNFAFAKVEYNKSKEFVHIFIHEDIVKIIKDALSDKKIKKYNLKCNDIYKYTMACVDVYGIVTLNKLYSLFIKQVYEIEDEEFKKTIEVFSLFDERVNIYRYDDEALITNMEFDNEDYAIDFYIKTEGIYHNFTKQDLYNIENEKYLKNLKSYKTLMNYLDRNFEGIKDDVQTINELLIMDYINIAQISKEQADKNVMNNLDDFFEADIIQKNKIRNMLQAIFNEYPKWIKKGNK